MQYILLGSAIMMEIIAATLLKVLEKFSKWMLSVGVHYFLCIVFLFVFKGTIEDKFRSGIRNLVCRRNCCCDDIWTENKYAWDDRNSFDCDRMCDSEFIRNGRLTEIL